MLLIPKVFLHLNYRFLCIQNIALAQAFNFYTINGTNFSTHGFQLNYVTVFYYISSLFYWWTFVSNFLPITKFALMRLLSTYSWQVWAQGMKLLQVSSILLRKTNCSVLWLHKRALLQEVWKENYLISWPCVKCPEAMSPLLHTFHQHLVTAELYGNLDSITALVFTDTEQPSLACSNSSMNFRFLAVACFLQTWTCSCVHCSCFLPACSLSFIFMYGAFGQNTVLVFANLAMFASMVCESLLKKKSFSTLKLDF